MRPAARPATAPADRLLPPTYPAARAAATRAGPGLTPRSGADCGQTPLPPAHDRRAGQRSPDVPQPRPVGRALARGGGRGRRLPARLAAGERPSDVPRHDRRRPAALDAPPALPGRRHPLPRAARQRAGRTRARRARPGAALAGAAAARRRPRRPGARRRATLPARPRSRSARRPRHPEWRGRRVAAARSAAHHALVLRPVLQHHAGAAHHRGQRLGIEVDRQAGLARQRPGQALQQ